MKAIHSHSNLRCLLLVPLLLMSGMALAQDSTVPLPGRINRNPVYRESLPPAPPVPPDSRDSTIRPVQPPEQVPSDGRSVVEGVPAPLPPSSAPISPSPRPAAPR
jgi:hypothetical protein